MKGKVYFPWSFPFFGNPQGGGSANLGPAPSNDDHKVSVTSTKVCVCAKVGDESVEAEVSPLAKDEVPRNEIFTAWTASGLSNISTMSPVTTGPGFL